MQDLFNWVTQTGLDRIVWATDMDLTLLDKSADPSKAAPAPGLIDAAQAIDRASAGFYIVTGRDIDFVDREVFPGCTMRISGEYHCHVRFNGAAADRVPRPRWDLIDADLKALLQDDWKLRLKPFMRSLHHHLPGDRADVKKKLGENLAALMQRLRDETGQDVEVIDGGPIFDMKPIGPDKFHAMQDVIADAKERTRRNDLLPLWFGDSPADLPAIPVAKAHGGKFVCVGGDERLLAHADFVLPDPAACRALLAKVAATAPAAP